MITSEGLYYEQSGFGKPLVLLHGLGSSTADWKVCHAKLADHFRVISIDFRGHGQSAGKTDGMTISDLGADVLAILDELYIGKAYFAGLSMGGMVTYTLALEAPERMLGMAILNSMPYLPQDTLGEKASIWARRIAGRLLPMEKLAKLMADKLLSRVEPSIKDAFEARLAAMSKQAYLDASNAILQFDLRAKLGGITVPTLILTSEFDYWSLDKKQACIDQMTSAKVELKELKNSGHASTVDAPDAVVAELVRFFNSL